MTWQNMEVSSKTNKAKGSVKKKIIKRKKKAKQKGSTSPTLQNWDFTNCTLVYARLLEYKASTTRKRRRWVIPFSPKFAIVYLTVAPHKGQ